jgi:mono/diheme cytochrome c family protein
MGNRVFAALAGLAFTGALLVGPAWSDDEEEIVVEDVEFTEEYLDNEEVIDAGEVIWEEQCQHCHGSKAYPGKAPKLKPYKYEPDFVFYRVTKGFKAMPPWKDIYTVEERMAVVAYVLSDDFSP